MRSIKENFITETYPFLPGIKEYLILQENLFQFSGKYYLLGNQWNSEGVNMPVVFAINIFMAKIEEENTSKCYQLLITDKKNYCLI